MQRLLEAESERLLSLQPKQQRLLYWFCSSSHRQVTRQKTGKEYLVVDLEVSFSDCCSLFTSTPMFYSHNCSFDFFLK